MSELFNAVEPPLATTLWKEAISVLRYSTAVWLWFKAPNIVLHSQVCNFSSVAQWWCKIHRWSPMGGSVVLYPQLIYCKPCEYIFLTSPSLSQVLFQTWSAHIQVFLDVEIFYFCVLILKKKISRCNLTKTDFYFSGTTSSSNCGKEWLKITLF